LDRLIKALHPWIPGLLVITLIGFRIALVLLEEEAQLRLLLLSPGTFGATARKVNTIDI